MILITTCKACFLYTSKAFSQSFNFSYQCSLPSCTCPLIFCAKPRGKTHPGGEITHQNNNSIGTGTSHINGNGISNNKSDGINVDTKINGNHSINPIKDIRRDINNVNGKKNERKSDNDSVAVDAVDEVVTYQNASSVSPSSFQHPSTTQQKRRPAPPPRDTDTMTKTKAILNEAADAVAKSFAKQTQGINKGKENCRKSYNITSR